MEIESLLCGLSVAVSYRTIFTNVVVDYFILLPWKTKKALGWKNHEIWNGLINMYLQWKVECFSLKKNRQFSRRHKTYWNHSVVGLLQEVHYTHSIWNANGTGTVSFHHVIPYPISTKWLEDMVTVFTCHAAVQVRTNCLFQKGGILTACYLLVPPVMLTALDLTGCWLKLTMTISKLYSWSL